MDDQFIDMSEGPEPTEWEDRFEAQINGFFDESIGRVPTFVDKHLRSFRRVMTRSVSPKTGIGDVLVGMRNVASNVSQAIGGPEFETTTYTHDALNKSFETEVVSTRELETLLSRLFEEFETAMWENVAEKVAENVDHEGFDLPNAEQLRLRLKSVMEKEIGHDPLLAQAIRSGVKIGVPATLGYVMFGRMRLTDAIATESYTKNLKFYNRILLRLGKFESPGWLGAVGWAGGVVGTLAIGGFMEYTVNSIRDIKGQYIRQMNAARYKLLYGDDPDDPQGRGILHIVRGLEREFERVPELSEKLQEHVESAPTKSDGNS